MPEFGVPKGSPSGTSFKEAVASFLIKPPSSREVSSSLRDDGRSCCQRQLTERAFPAEHATGREARLRTRRTLSPACAGALPKGEPFGMVHPNFMGTCLLRCWLSAALPAHSPSVSARARSQLPPGGSSFRLPCHDMQQPAKKRVSSGTPELPLGGSCRRKATEGERTSNMRYKPQGKKQRLPQFQFV